MWLAATLVVDRAPIGDSYWFRLTIEGLLGRTRPTGPSRSESESSLPRLRWGRCVARRPPQAGATAPRPPPIDRHPPTGRSAAAHPVFKIISYPAFRAPSTTPSTRPAPALSSGTFPLPHLGDCTHEGQPVAHSQSRIAERVAESQSASTA